MRSVINTLLALPVLALAAPVLNIRETADSIPGSFLVKFNAVSANMSTIASEVTSLLGIDASKTFNIGSFKAMTIEGPDSILEMLASLPNVEYVERDSKVYASALVSQSSAPWGLTRISHRSLGSSNYIYDSTAGSGTFSYIIDTGIYTQHADFGGRATFGASFVSGEGAGDGNGHGTHVAGTTGSTTYGVAKKTSLIAVKVLGGDGSGTNSGVIQGIEWAVNDAKSKSRIGKAVANMSLGGSFSQAVNDAVKAATDAGLFMAVAAGNENQNAANSSPASAASACTVGATDSKDTRASFSNYGSVVDIFGPGVNIISTWNNGGTNTISGTSMASPHIAGLGAYLLGLEGARSPAALCQRIQSLSTKNVITGTSGSVNYLAYNGNGA